MLTGSNLFIKEMNPLGSFNCYYCGAFCQEKKENHVKINVKDSFTNRDIVQFPSSNYVCDGCIACMNEKAEIELITGEKIINRNRIYSWVVDQHKNIAYSKAHIQLIRDVILNPPEPPFVIVIATSGQKQLLFRSVIAYDKKEYPLLFEEKCVIVNVNELKQALDIATNVCAALGKISLKEEPDYAMGIKYYDAYGNLNVFNYWYDNYKKDIYQLSAYLCEPKEQCVLKMKGVINEKVK